MAREDRAERFTWKAGDVIVTDRDGNPIDFDKLNKQKDGGEEDKKE